MNRPITKAAIRYWWWESPDGSIVAELERREKDRIYVRLMEYHGAKLELMWKGTLNYSAAMMQAGMWCSAHRIRVEHGDYP